MPTIIRKPSDVSKLDAIYDALDEAVEEGTIPQEQIDKSVRRVLTLKKDREILDSKDTRDLDDKIDDALKTVGSEAHKDTERRAAEKARSEERRVGKEWRRRVAREDVRNRTEGS